jgi:uncharacterized membrane protein
MTENKKPQINNPQNGEGYMISHQKMESFVGPVPHPEIVEKYEKIYPGAAKIIFEEWDRQVKHRHEIENRVIKTDNTKSILGVIFGFIVVIVAISGGIYTVLQGKQLFGGGLSFVGLAMLATAFITSRKRKDK